MVKGEHGTLHRQLILEKRVKRWVGLARYTICVRMETPHPGW